jgi:hypothetical protein
MMSRKSKNKKKKVRKVAKANKKTLTKAQVQDKKISTVCWKTKMTP